MEAPTQIRKPENWQDFESLCKNLWGEIWKCADSIKKNGRSGQKQCGVDVYAISEDKTGYYGIQCKGKDDYTNAQLTKNEIDRELAKAMDFVPPLQKLIFATTANKDVDIEEYIRVKNIEHIRNGLFEVDVMSWEDIVDLMKAHRNTYNWYINNCMYNDVADVEVSLMGAQEYTIYPEYIRTIRTTELKPHSICDLTMASLRDYNFNIPVIDPFQRKHDFRWQDVYVKIRNIGSVSIDDFKLYVDFERSELQIRTQFDYIVDPFLPAESRNYLNSRADLERDVFETEHGLVYEPSNVLLLTDEIFFKFRVLANDNLKEIPIKWRFISRNFTKCGSLKIIIEHKIIDRYEKIMINSIDEYKEPEEVITPRIETLSRH